MTRLSSIVLAQSCARNRSTNTVCVLLTLKCVTPDAKMQPEDNQTDTKCKRTLLCSQCIFKGDQRFMQTVEWKQRNPRQTMIGVILWSDPNHQKAVVWCEDHGDLAYLARPDLIALPEPFVDAGDVIEFDLSCDTDTRRVRNVRLLAQAAATPLVNDLKNENTTQQNTRPLTGSAEVIPFRAAAASAANTSQREPMKRQG